MTRKIMSSVMEDALELAFIEKSWDALDGQPLKQVLAIPPRDKRVFRVAVLCTSTDYPPRNYWADSGCGELSYDKAQEVCAAGQRNRERCMVVPANYPMFKGAL